MRMLHLQPLGVVAMDVLMQQHAAVLVVLTGNHGCNHGAADNQADYPAHVGGDEPRAGVSCLVACRWWVCPVTGCK